MNVRARIDKLVQLASSPNENEARNAALLACRLMRDHGIRLEEPAHFDPACIVTEPGSWRNEPPPWEKREEEAKREARRRWSANWDATFRKWNVNEATGDELEELAEVLGVPAR